MESKVFANETQVKIGCFNKTAKLQRDKKGKSSFERQGFQLWYLIKQIQRLMIDSGIIQECFQVKYCKAPY